MTVEQLVLKGYFPEEITPVFVTEDLEKILPKILPDIDVFDPLLKGKITKLLPFSVPKVKAYRRNISIPNPLAFVRLSKTIIENWVEIIDFTNKSKLSLSPLDEGSNRAIKQPSFDKITKERILRSTGFKYLLKIDILRFYGSIYTHSIPWALHTKSLSKSKRKRVDLFGNAMDEDVRKMQDGQTMGLPIGPDTSRVISEIIACFIDLELQSQIKGIQGIRVIDDYSLYFKNLGDLEIARSLILKLLKGFELDLNQSKEKVVELPEQIESEWYNRLRDFKFRNDVDLQSKDIIAYFDMSFGYSSKYPDEVILPYSLSKISASIFNIKNWDILESFLLKSLLVEPKVLPYTIRLFISHNKKGYPLNTKLIKIAIEEFIEFHLNLDNHFEVSWALWLFKKLEIELSDHMAKLLSKSDNSVIILTTLDLNSSGLIPSGIDTTEWEKLLTVENLYNEHWLLAYESIIKGWLRAKVDYISKDPFFKVLKDNNVEFYKEEKEIDLTNIKVNSEDVSLLKFRSDLPDDDLPEDYEDADYDDLDDDFSYKVKRPTAINHMLGRNDKVDWDDLLKSLGTSSPTPPSDEP